MNKHYYLTALIMALLILFFATPAEAAGDPALTSLHVSIAGVDKNIQLDALRTEYSVDIQTDTALPVTVNATAAADCSIYLLSGRTQQPLPQTLTVTPGTTTSVALIVVNASGQKNAYQLDLAATPTSSQGADTDTTETGSDPDPAENTAHTPTPDREPPTETGPGTAATNGQATNGQTTNGQTTNGQTTNGQATNGQATNGGPGASPPMTHLIMYINAPFYFLNDVYRDMDAAPYLVTGAKGGYTMVPLRFVAESLGARVSWQAVTKTVGIDLDGRHFQLVIGQLVPGTPVAATIVRDRTFVPLRYVMESFGALVFWTQKEKRIDIYYAPDSTA